MKTVSWFCAHCGAANDDGGRRCFACQRIQDDDEKKAVNQVNAALLRGRYRLLSVVGTGGFGVVYRALDAQQEREVAIKQINLRGLSPQETIDATDGFHREVQLLSVLSHEHLPRIYEHFTDPDHWYLVMEFVEGESLDRYVDERRRSLRPTNSLLPLDEIYRMALQLCSVLSYLHSRQPAIIYRDLKPDNILRTSKGHLFVIDFGIARHFKPGQPRDTIPFGSPGYAAPEQYGKAQTTPRTDIYSLGALLHFLLSGDDPAEAPFAFTPLHLLPTEAPLELAKLVRQMVALDALKRPASVEVVQEELKRLSLLPTFSSGRLWTPPPGQTPPVDLAKQPVNRRYWQTAPLPNGQQGMQMMQQRTGASQGKSGARRKFIRRSIAATAGLALAGGGIWYFGDSMHNRPILNYDLNYAFSSGEPIRDLVWSSDGSMVAFLSGQDPVRILQVVEARARGAVLFQNYYADSNLAPEKLAWSQDDTVIAGAGKQGIDVWQILDSNQLAHIDEAQVLALALSPDGRKVAWVSEQLALGVWDIRQKKAIDRVAGDGVNEPVVLTWSPYGQKIVNNARFAQALEHGLPMDALWLWNAIAHDYEILPFVEANLAAWSSYGILATIDSEGGIYVQDMIASVGNRLRGIRVKTGLRGISEMAWSKDGKYLALVTSSPATIEVWEPFKRTKNTTLSLPDAVSDGLLGHIGWSDGGTSQYLSFASLSGEVWTWEID